VYVIAGMVIPKPAASDADAFADRRAYPRIGLALPAVLRANGERYAVHLLDVSAGGAKLKCAASLAVGTSVMLDCGALCGAATVRWQNAGLAGVKFDNELDERVVQALVHRSSALAALMKSRD
jgi:PilZ domain